MNISEQKGLRPKDIYMLKKEGFVVEGEYPEVNNVKVSINGQDQFFEVPVRAHVVYKNVDKPNQEIITVFQPKQEIWRRLLDDANLHRS